MAYRCTYKTPEGFSDILLRSDGEALTGLFFASSKDLAQHLAGCVEAHLAIFAETRRWLDLYFRGESPDFTPRYRIDGLTSFRRQVIDAMNAIPFGETVTYGEIAKGIARENGMKTMSAQAVGGAVGWNPICIIIPCHRVLGANGALTGYGGGIQNKIALLAHEKAHVAK